MRVDEDLKTRPADRKRTRILLVVILLLVVGAGLGCLVSWFVLTKKSDQTIVRVKNVKPNFIIFLADDTGYGDFHVYGHPNQEKNGIDRMAEEGMKFTHFYSPVAVCTPSRAAILTGK